ncbi:Caspase domain-containing protein [Flavobacteriaceae bacterium MAR_2010_188]|nr:Caspase domain-containing protein [Flavobacteriaceae bacterium MAR_2010_188]
MNTSFDNAYALLIGVGDPDLPTVLDAQAISNLLSDPEYAGYKDENIIMVSGEDATRDNILGALDKLIEKTDEDSSVMIYYSGHGGTYTDNDLISFTKSDEPKKSDEENQTHFFLQPVDIDVDRIKETWVKAEEFKERIQALKSRKQILFLDCCHAEGMTKSSVSLNGGKAKSNKKNKLTSPEGLAKKLDNEKGICIISSCKDDQLSWSMDGDTNSLFTLCLLEVLRGEHNADFNQPYVTMTDTVKYIMNRVPERQPAQTPFANLQIYSDFILSRIPAYVKQQNGSEKLSINNEPEENLTKDSASFESNFRKTETAKNLLIFVHGFSGQGNETFGKIPKLITEDSDLKGWDIIPFGYSKYADPDLGKNVWASLYNINHAADNLTASIKYQYQQYNRIALVSHGLGGLVVQKSILDLAEKDLNRITHVLLFASPNNGVPKDVIEELNDPKLKELSEDSDFISGIRKKWNTQLGHDLPFKFKTIAATNDEYIPVSSSLEVFDKKYQVVVGGNHFSIVDVNNKENDSYELIVNELTDNEFYHQYTSKEEINNLLGEYESVVQELLPQKDSLNIKGLRNLTFALEGLDRGTEVLDILNNHPLAKDNSDLLGILGGRYKRLFLKTYNNEHGQKALDFYRRGLEISKQKDNTEQIYYHAINLAFLSLIFEEDKSAMREYATVALDAATNDPFDSLWKKSTLAEANLYLGKFEDAKDFYGSSAAMGGVRDKISIYTNAFAAYSNLMKTTSDDDNFIKFLKETFLK